MRKIIIMNFLSCLAFVESNALDTHRSVIERKYGSGAVHSYDMQHSMDWMKRDQKRVAQKEQADRANPEKVAKKAEKAAQKAARKAEKAARKAAK